MEVELLRHGSGDGDPTEILEHVLRPEAAIDEIHRVLKPSGVCLLSTRFICPYHPDPHDYYRYSPDSLTCLFRKFRDVGIVPHGNRPQLLWQLLGEHRFGLPLQLLNPVVAKVNVPRTRYPFGFVVRARK